MFRIDGPFFFGVAAELMSAYRRLGSIPRVLIVRLDGVALLDASGVAAFGELGTQARRAGVRLILCGVGADAGAMLRRADLEGGTDVTNGARTFEQALALAQPSEG